MAHEPSSPRQLAAQQARRAGARAGADELDALIAQAESAVVLRDRRFAERAAHLEHRLVATAVQGAAVAAIAGTVAVVGHALLSRGRHHAPPPARWRRSAWRRGVDGHDEGEPLASKGATAAATVGLAALLGAVPWRRVLPMVWPRLPAPVRQHMSGETAGLWVSIVLPVLLRWRRPRAR